MTWLSDDACSYPFTRTASRASPRPRSAGRRGGPRRSRPRGRNWREDDFPVDAEGNRLCDCCGVPMWISTGATVCPATAAATAWIQHRWLCAAGDDALLDDLFEVFDLVEEEFYAIFEGPPLRSRERLNELAMVWLAVCWLIEQGIEDVATGRARLFAEMSRLADRHGDPEGVLKRPSRAVLN